jgi:hypothetical protein
MDAIPPRWNPTTEDELEQAGKADLLDEGGGRLEFKREVAAGASHNRELAKDLASLAINGGLFLIGVNDVKARPPTLHAVDLAGLPERVEQVAAMKCDPPLLVRCTPIPCTANSAKGYLAVLVPPSPQAPHMVEGRYWGRGDRTKRALSDSEVAVLHQRRQLLERNAAESLTDYVGRDPMVDTLTPNHSHLFVVAEPNAASDSMLLEVAKAADNLQTWIFKLVRRRADDDPGFGELYAPDIGYANDFGHRADGWALSSFESAASGRDLAGMDEEKLKRLETRLIEVELSENGAVRLFCGRASDNRESDPNFEFAFEALVGGLTMRVLRIAANIADATGFWGTWNLGLAITDSKGKYSWLRAESHFYEGTPYTAAKYLAFTRASTEELSDLPGDVATRLVGRFLRAFGTEEHPTIQALFFPNAGSGS